MNVFRVMPTWKMRFLPEWCFVVGCSAFQIRIAYLLYQPGMG